MTEWIDISSPVCPNDTKSQPFGLPNAISVPSKSQTYENKLTKSPSYYCDEITLCAHGNGTHTEISGHIRVKGIQRSYMTERYPPVLMRALLITVPARKWIHQDGHLIDDQYRAIHNIEDDIIISREEIQKKLDLWRSKPSIDELSKYLQVSSQMALIVRTNERTPSSGFPYWTESATDLLKTTIGFEHLLIDTPSLDREEDEGQLRSHRVFFGEDLEESRHTLTELCRIPEQVEDGWYWLNLQCSPLRSDAVPSRPMILRIK